MHTICHFFTSNKIFDPEYLPVMVELVCVCGVLCNFNWVLVFVPNPTLAFSKPRVTIVHMENNAVAGNLLLSTTRRKPKHDQKCDRKQNFLHHTVTSCSILYTVKQKSQICVMHHDLCGTLVIYQHMANSKSTCVKNATNSKKTKSLQKMILIKL